MFIAHVPPLAPMGVARETTARMWRGRMTWVACDVRRVVHVLLYAVILGGSGGAWLMQGRASATL